MAGTIRLNGVPCAAAIYSSPSLLPALSADPSAPPFLWLGRCGGGGAQEAACVTSALWVIPGEGGVGGGGSSHHMSSLLFAITLREKQKRYLWHLFQTDHLRM